MAESTEHFGGEDDTPVSMFHYINRKALASFELIFCISGLVTNFVVIAGILLEPKLRRSSKHFIIVNICIVCLIQIGVLGTTNTYSSITNHYIVGPDNCFSIVLEAIGYFNVSVVLMLVTALCIDAYLDMLLPHTTGKKIRVCVATELILCSWFGSAILIVPLVVYGKIQPTSCDFDLKEKYRTMLGLLHYLPQAVIVFFLGMLLLLCTLIKRGRDSLTQRPNEFPIDILVACLIVITLNLPFSVFSTAFNYCSKEEGDACASMYTFWAVSSRLSFSTFVVLPYVWMLSKAIRQSLHRVLCCCSKQPNVNRNSYVSVYTDNDLRL
ncbi:green-sensitive opsin-2-like [Haliotis rufescens]|uniref:green-sensitive opsin-2-like n=1 Tax=Haliotis rufescens TaxID=6454 RepID=UPI001EB0527B|nr:green-sensitive opsin-2-like [Haliotis rufescens]